MRREPRPWCAEGGCSKTFSGPHPPPPRSAVPQGGAPGAEKKPASVRERLEEHRKNPACASCHARMDPLGFSLENFDSLGQWRTMEAGGPMHAAGGLLDRC